MGLRTLHQDAWPHASAEQRDAQLKRCFDEGLSSPEMIQYLRLHARNNNFDETVLKARQFVDASETAKQVFVSQGCPNRSLSLIQRAAKRFNLICAH